jgi:hypothetical protein
MDYIPIDTSTTKPTSGGFNVPDGWYILQVTDATELRQEQNGEHTRRAYKCKIVQGPGATMEQAGKPFTDFIRDSDPQWAGRHMELFVACLGSIEAVQQTGAQHQNRLPANILHGRYYIAQLVKSGNFTNVVQRLPYTQENWNENAGAAPQPAAAPNAAAPIGMLAAPAPAPAPAMAAPAPVAAMPAPAPAPMMAAPAPAMAAPVMAAPAPVAAMPPPAVPTVPAMAAPAPAPAAAPGGMPATPTPPPPPGVPSV